MEPARPLNGLLWCGFAIWLWCVADWGQGISEHIHVHISMRGTSYKKESNQTRHTLAETIWHLDSTSKHWNCIEKRSCLSYALGLHFWQPAFDITFGLHSVACLLACLSACLLARSIVRGRSFRPSDIRKTRKKFHLLVKSTKQRQVEWATKSSWSLELTRETVSISQLACLLAASLSIWWGKRTTPLPILMLMPTLPANRGSTQPRRTTLRTSNNSPMTKTNVHFCRQTRLHLQLYGINFLIGPDKASRKRVH